MKQKKIDYQFSKRKGKYIYTFDYSYDFGHIAKYIAQICYSDPQSAWINMQSPQSATTPGKLTLELPLDIDKNIYV